MQRWGPKVVFLTHTHSDHVHYLPHIKNKKNPPTIYLPQEAEHFVKAYLVAHQEMSDCMTEAESQNGGRYATDYVLKPMKAGEEVSCIQKGQKYVIQTLKMHHRIPCLGYSIFSIRQKLKEDYRGLAGPDIGRLRKKGVEVTEEYREPLICFMGDTTGEVFNLCPDILSQHKTVVIECSFIDDASINRARETKHMHWNDLKPFVEKHPDTLFLLTHLSLKYSASFLFDFFGELKKKYANIQLVLNQEEAAHS